MKLKHFYWPLWLLLFPLCLYTLFSFELEGVYAQEEQAELKPAPLYPLTSEFPIELTGENRERLTDPYQLKSLFASNEAQLRRHTFPWKEALLLLLGGMIIYLWRVWRAYKLAQAAVPLPIDPKIEALEALKGIEREAVLQKRGDREFYTQLSQLVRRYLARELQISPLAMTTEELLDFIEEKNFFPVTIQEDLKRFLIQTELVQFARYQPSFEESQTSYQFVKQMLDTHSDSKT